MTTNPPDRQLGLRTISPCDPGRTSRDDDSRMYIAITTFRTRMRSANSTFLAERIAEIENSNLPSEDAKLNATARFWQHSDTWERDTRPVEEFPPGWSAERREFSWQEVRNTRLVDVRDLPRPGFDGIILAPSSAWTAQQREIAVEELARVVAATRYKHIDRVEIPAPDELRSFLKYAAGVVDIDLRYSGIPQFEVLRCSPRDDLDDFRRAVKAEFTQLCGIEDYIRDDFAFSDMQVQGGIETGFQLTPSGDIWRSYYLYCRDASRDDGDDGDGEDDQKRKEWAWRVVLYPHAICDDDPIVYYESIADFLDEYASWPDDVDYEELREQMYSTDSLIWDDPVLLRPAGTD